MTFAASEKQRKRFEEHVLACVGQQKRQEETLKEMVAMEIQLKQPEEVRLSTRSPPPAVTKSTTGTTRPMVFLTQAPTQIVPSISQFPPPISMINSNSQCAYYDTLSKTYFLDCHDPSIKI